LSEGIVHGHKVTCPLHNWVINLEDGEAQGADEGHTACFETKVEAGIVFINL
jgi:nitrite reductase (NADH) small subunit